MKIRFRSLLSFARLFCCAALVLLLVTTGCARKSYTPPSEQKYLMHSIEYQGETLTIIAAWYTGSGQNWRELAAANPEVRPNRLRPGTLIRIPRVLLTRDAALPKSFVDAATSKLKNMPPEKGAEDTQPVQVTAPENPRPTPPVAEDQPSEVTTTTESEPATETPTLPDPTTQFVEPAVVEPTEAPVVVEEPASSSSSSEVAVSSEPAAHVVKEEVEPASSSSSSSVAPVKSEDSQKAEDHKKTRDQLLKELLQDY